MLSILVPVYNFNITDFVSELNQQASSCNIDFEILVYDDCSSSTYREENKIISDISSVNYLELSDNLGRSKIRNLLAENAQYDYLLFVDCDSEITSPDYIQNFTENLKPNLVLYGGRSYDQTAPKNPKKHLRWYYGIEREQHSLEERKKYPYRTFMTNNFVIPKTIYTAVKCNETLSGYGHEDTLFAQELKQKNIAIIHIENHLSHIGLEDAYEFLLKTKNGVKNLAYLIKNKLIDEENRLYSSYNLLQKLGIIFVLKLFANTLENWCFQKLIQPKPKLYWFDLYKLVLLIQELN